MQGVVAIQNLQKSGLTALAASLVMALALFFLTRFLYLHRAPQLVLLTLEDSAGEYASCLAWLIATILFFGISWRGTGFHRVVYLVFALVAFLLAMEEISWGQRIFGWESSEYFRTENLQGETNLHNLVQINPFYKPTAFILVLVCIIPWGLTRAWSRFRALWESWGLPVIEPRLWPFFLLSAIFLGSNRYPRGAEIGELFLAISVALFALDQWILTRDRPTKLINVGTAPWILAGALLLGTAAMVRLLPSSPDALIAEGLNELAVNQFLWGELSVAEQVFDYLVEHPEHQTRNTPFYYGLLLSESGRKAEARSLLSTFLAENQEPVQADDMIERGLRNAARLRKLGFSSCALESPDQAGAYFEDAVAAGRATLKLAAGTPQESETRNSLAVSLEALGKERAARNAQTMAKQSAPDQLSKKLGKRRWRETRRLIRLAGCDS